MGLTQVPALCPDPHHLTSSGNYYTNKACS